MGMGIGFCVRGRRETRRVEHVGQDRVLEIRCLRAEIVGR